jgi:alpha-glucosidase
MSYSFVQVDQFTPNAGDWVPIGNITSWNRTNNTLTLTRDDSRSLQISFLGPTSFRVRFNPNLNPDYTRERSFAVVSRELGTVNLRIDDFQSYLCVDTGFIQVRIDLQPYRIQVYRQGQLICADEPSYNLVFIPDQTVVANFKTYPANAQYCGFGQKAGATLFKNQSTMTFFNYDNFIYSSGPIPSGQTAGPCNPSEPLYSSIPLLIEINPNPVGAFAGAPYCYGIFFDNTAQSYFNIGVDSSSNMYGKYYFGALYGEMDYYVMVGDQCGDILQQYTTLTGRSSMPPKYAFGFHQGGYGYFDRYVLSKVANAYRAAHIPIDGLHIDVDFQNNYRTFTHSEIKFPNAAEMMSNLHTIGFKCSTNITPLLTSNPLDEYGEPVVYQQGQALLNANALLYDTEDYDGPNPNVFQGQVSYGMNPGNNPYPYPPLSPNRDGQIPLGAYGNYCDFGREDVRQIWGQQYEHLIQDLDMDMIWQDMMCPAIDANLPDQPKTFPLGLMMSDGNGEYVPNAAIHNSYGLYLLDATWNGIKPLRQAVKNQRNFIIARGGYAGMQRYAGLWTGDSPSSWDYLSILVPQVLNIGLSGVPISGADIGGFANGSGTTADFYESYGKIYEGITNYELLTRWMHVGAFLPWYRNHYNGYTKQFQEIYEYGEPVPTNCRKYVELRYRMLQVFYDAMYQWTQTGMPICRPLFLNDPRDLQCYSDPWVNTEFFVGHDVLVAPIVSQHETANPPTLSVRPVYLPQGSDWYSFKDNQYPLDAPVAGGTLISDWYAPLDLVPIYIRAGAILPMRELEQYVGQLPQNPLTINIYPGPDSSYQLYLDDGITFDAEDKGAYRLVQIGHKAISGGRTVRVQRLINQYTPAEMFYYVALLGTQHPSSVTIADQPLMDVQTPENLTMVGASAYYWNSSIQITFIKVFDTQADVTISVMD